MSNERSVEQQLSGFFNAVQDAEGNYDKVYLAEDFAALLRSMFSDGIFRESGDPQYENSAFQIWPSLLDQSFLSVWQGRAMIKGYWFDNIAYELDMSSYMNQSIDKKADILIKLDLNLREFEIYAKEHPSEISDDEYVIYTVDIPANSTSSQEFTLTDNRGIFCPWVRSIADQDPAIYNNVPIIDGYPLVERGENENGSWEKWWDGTLICRGDASEQGGFGGTVSPYYSSAVLFTYPIEFIEKPDVFPFAHINGGGSYQVFGSVHQTPTKSSVYILGLCSTKFSNANVQVGYEAKGRWK